MAQYRSKAKSTPKKEFKLEEHLLIPTHHDTANNIIKEIKRFVTEIVELNKEIRKLKKENLNLKQKLGHIKK